MQEDKNKTIKIVLSVFFTMALATLAGVLARKVGNAELKKLDYVKLYSPTCLFSIFFILLRTKMFLDDMGYFKKQIFSNSRTKIGFAFAFCSWFCFILAGAASFSNIDTALGVLFAAIVFATIAIPFFPKISPKCCCWLLFNVLYGLIIFLMGAVPCIPKEIGLIFLIVVCLIDIICNDSFGNLFDSKDC